MIHVGTFLSAIGWNIAGAGILAKFGCEKHRTKLEESRRKSFYAPMMEFYDKYGVSHDEYQRLNYGPFSHGGAEPYMRIVREKANIDVPSWCMEKVSFFRSGYMMGSNMAGIVAYYAACGRVLRETPGAHHNFPMAGFFTHKPEWYTEMVKRLLIENGVKDVYWYFDDVESRIKRLNDIVRTREIK